MGLLDLILALFRVPLREYRDIRRAIFKDSLSAFSSVSVVFQCFSIVFLCFGNPCGNPGSLSSIRLHKGY